MWARELRCVVCGLRSSSVFCCLEGPLLEKLDREKMVHEYRPGHPIVYEGNPPFAVYCIQSGCVKLSKAGGDAEPLVLRLLGPGETLGYRAVLAGEPYDVTAEAVEPTTVCTIPRQTLIELLRSSRDLAFQFLAKLSREIRLYEDQMLLLSKESVRRRAAHLLLMLLESSNSAARAGGRIRLPVRRREMAQMIATTPETLSRTLHALARQGVVALTRSQVQIVDAAALRRIAKHDVSEPN